MTLISTSPSPAGHHPTLRVIQRIAAGYQYHSSKLYLICKLHYPRIRDLRSPGLLASYYLAIYIYICFFKFIEGSLEVKLPTMSMWTDGKAEVGRVREEKESVKKMIKGRVVGSVQPWGPGAIILSPNSWGLDPRPLSKTTEMSTDTSLDVKQLAPSRAVATSATSARVRAWRSGLIPCKKKHV